MARKTVTKPSTRKAYIDQVPIEILDRICGCLPLESLKQARLNCKRLKPHCEKQMFKTIILWKTERDWRRLYNICRAPHLAPLLTHIKFIRTNNLPQYSDFNDYWDAIPWQLRRNRTRVSKRQKKELRAGYRRYREWRIDEESMDEALQQKKSYNLASYLIPKLLHYRLTIETISHKQLEEYYQQREDDGHRVHNRRERETFIVGNTSKVYGNQHLELFLKVTEASDKNMTALKLHHPEEVLVHRPAYRRKLNHLRHLTIDLQGQDERIQWENVFVDGKKWELAPWIGELPSLDHFVLCQSAIDPAVNLLEALQTVKWPRLERIELFNITTTAKALQSFLNKFRGSLRSLKMINPVVRPSTMAVVRREVSRLDTEFKILRPADCVFTDVYEHKRLSKLYEGSKKEYCKIRRAGGEMWEQTKTDLLEKWHDGLVFLP